MASWAQYVRTMLAVFRFRFSCFGSICLFELAFPNSIDSTSNKADSCCGIELVKDIPVINSIFISVKVLSAK